MRLSMASVSGFQKRYALACAHKRGEQLACCSQPKSIMQCAARGSKALGLQDSTAVLESGSPIFARGGIVCVGACEYRPPCGIDSRV